MPTMLLTIAGVAKILYAGSLAFNITETANGRNTLTCTIASFDGSYRPVVGAEFVLTEDGTRIFGGNIDVPTESGFGGVGGTAIVTTISAVDFNALAGRRFVSGQIPAGTLKAALQWLEPYLTPFGVSLDAGQATGPSLPALPFDYLVLTEVLNQISKLTNGAYTWEIDYNKKLRMALASSTAAPFNIVNSDGHVDGDVTVEPAASDYANRIILRFSAAARPAYAFLETTANFGNGETVVIGGTTYTYKTTLTATAGDVLIGGSEDISLDNLANAVVLGAGSGSAYSSATVKNSSVEAYWFRASMLCARALNAGASGNNISVTETAANAAWITEGGDEVTTLCLGSDVSLSERVFADDLTEQGTIGLWERVIDDATVFDPTVAQLLANAALAQAVAKPKRVTYSTYYRGLHPGQVQSITVATRNLTRSYILTDVQIRNNIGNLVRSTVTAVGGTTLPTMWQDAAKQMFSGGGSSSTSGGMFIVSGGGGGGGGVSALHVHLGGSRSDYYPTSAWMPILGYLTFTCRVDGAYTFRTESCSLSAGTSVQVRLYDITAASAVTGSTTTATASTTWVESELPVTCIAGHKYFAEMIGSNDSNGVACGQAEVER